MNADGSFACACCHVDQSLDWLTPTAAVRVSYVQAACNAVLATFGKCKRQICKPQVIIACQSSPKRRHRHLSASATLHTGESTADRISCLELGRALPGIGESCKCPADGCESVLSPSLLQVRCQLFPGTVFPSCCHMQIYRSALSAALLYSLKLAGCQHHWLIRAS